MRERFTVDEVLLDGDGVVGIRGRGDDGRTVSARARVVIGADGRNSLVARAVQPREYNTKPMLQWDAYTYWRDLPVGGMETVIRPDRGWAAMPTNNGLTLLVVGWPGAESAAVKADVERNYLDTLALAPEFADRVRRATRVDRFHTGGVPNCFRQPYGPGWVLVGDAGCTKDPITAQGILDAVRDAEACAAALDDVFGGRRPYEDALARFHTARDQAVMPIYEFTTQLATLEPPPPEVQQLLGAMHGNQPAMDAFVSVIASTMSPVELFDPDHVHRLLTAPAA